MPVKAYGISVKNSSGKYILESLDFFLEEGKVTLIGGRSGSGKTTLLSVLAGLQRPAEGEVFYGDLDIYKMTDGEAALYRNREIGLTPQGQSALYNLTVKENILLPSRIGDGSGDQGAYADELMSKLGIEDLKDSYPDKMSGGEIRRMAIARALINRPAFVFADEPTGDLDDENTKKVFELFRETARGGAAVLIVSHEQEAERYADKIYLMESGKLKKRKGNSLKL